MNARRTIVCFAAALAATVTLSRAAPAGDLNVYYGMSRDLFDPIIRAFADANPDVKTNSFRAPTEELMATIELELRAGRPRADVVVSVAPQLHGLQKLYGALQAYEPAELSAVRADLRDGARLLTPVGLNLYTIQYNTNRVRPQDVPKRILDVLDPKWQNQIAIADPKNSASVHSLFWFVTSHLAESRGAPPYGWHFFQELRKLNPRAVASHGTIRSLVQTGERPIGFQMLSDAMLSVAQGEPAAFVFPEEGAPAEVSSIAIMRGSRNVAEARRFVDFLVSTRGQELMQKLGGYVPVRSDVTMRLPDGRTVAEIKVVPVDAAFITAEQRRENMQRFQEIMR